MQSEGKISEWNEANFKSKRLDSIQSTINMLKMNPTGITEGKFNYLWMVKNVDILYGEGYSKYSKKERIEIDKIRDLVLDALKFFPPHKKSRMDNPGGSVETYMISEKNLNMLLDLLELFERKAKDFNDEHGLTTRNKGESGLF